MKWFLFIFGVLSMIVSGLLIELMRVMPGAPDEFKVLVAILGLVGLASTIVSYRIFKKEKDAGIT
jgi:hypothetical protein